MTAPLFLFPVHAQLCSACTVKGTTVSVSCHRQLTCRACYCKSTAVPSVSSCRKTQRQCLFLQRHHRPCFMLPHHGFLCKHCHFLVLSQPTDLRPLHSDSQHPLLQAPPSACCSTPTRSTCICASTTILCCHTLTSSACSSASTAVSGSVTAHQLVVTASRFYSTRFPTSTTLCTLPRSDL